jgi:TrmH family RNA methyltransferase
VIRSTMGSIFHLPVFDEVDLRKAIPQMKKREFRILGTHVKGGKSIDRLQLAQKTCLLMGSEAEGLSKDLIELSDEIVHIPCRGETESLNVAMAGGILLYEISKKLMRS